MKHYSLLAALLMLMLTGCNRHAEQMLSALEQQGVGLIVENNGETTTYCQHGVKDLLYLTANEPERLKGAVVADKRVSKAAACLMIEGGVKRVNTPLVSTPARQMLEAAGIALYAREEVPLMMNRDGTDLCPMEKKLLVAKTPEQCAAILRGATVEGFQMLNMLNE